MPKLPPINLFAAPPGPVPGEGEVEVVREKKGGSAAMAMMREEEEELAAEGHFPDKPLVVDAGVAVLEESVELGVPDIVVQL